MSLRHHGILIVHSIACAFASFAISARAIAHAALDYGQRWLEATIEAIAPSRPAFAFGAAHPGILNSSGIEIDRALQNDMRHESRIARRGAHRNI